VIADIAAAFHDLEQQRDELTALNAAREELSRRQELASLEHAERHATTTAKTAAREKDKKNLAERAVVSRSAKHDESRSAAALTRELVTTAAAEAEQAAAGAGLARDHGLAVTSLALPDGITAELTRAAEEEFAAAATRREVAVAHVTALATAAAEAERKAAAEQAKLAELEAERDAAADEREAAEAAAQLAGETLVARWREYAAGTTELDLPYPDETGLPEWTVTLDGPNPAEAALEPGSAARAVGCVRRHPG